MGASESAAALEGSREGGGLSAPSAERSEGGLDESDAGWSVEDEDVSAPPDVSPDEGKVGLVGEEPEPASGVETFDPPPEAGGAAGACDGGDESGQFV